MIKARKVAVLAAVLLIAGAGIAEARPGGGRGGGHGARPAYVHGGHGYRPYYRPFYRPYFGASLFAYPAYPAYYPPVYPSPAYYAPQAPMEYIELPREDLQYQQQPRQFYQQPQPQLQPQPQSQSQPQFQAPPQPQAQSENREFSYYCAAPQGYYPDVPTCPGGWERTQR